MIIKVRRGADQTQVQQLTDWLKEQGLQLYFSEGTPTRSSALSATPPA